MPSTSIDKYKPIKSKAQCRANKLFTISRAAHSHPPEVLFLPLDFTRRDKQSGLCWIQDISLWIYLHQYVSHILLPVSKIEINISDMMAMARTIPETVALHPLSNVGHSKKDITQTLTLTQYHFIIHSRSTTHYLQICCPISTTTTPQGVISSFSCKPNEKPSPLSERGQGSDCDKRRIPFPSHEDELDP